MSPTVERTPRHTPLLTVRITIAGEEVDAVVDTGASAPVIGERIAKKLGCWKRARKVKVRQGDGSTLAAGKYVVNTTFKVFFEGSLLGRFTLDAEVLEIGKQDVILGLSWLEEHGFWVDTQARCLGKDLSGLVIPCSIRWIPSVSILGLDLEPLEDGEILLIIDASERYPRCAQCFSTEQAARLPEHKSWDHKIPSKTPKLRYLLELSARQPVKKMKPSKTTSERTYQLVNFVDHALLQVHQSSSSRKKMDA